MPRKRPAIDAVQSAASIFASVMATDEEFAAGVHLKNPKAILSPKVQAKDFRMGNAARKKRTK